MNKHAYHSFAVAILIFSLGAISSAQDYAPRVWKAKSGAFELRARLVEQTAQTVKLRATDDGRIVETAIENLSAEDVEYLKQNQLPTDTKLIEKVRKIQTARELTEAARRQYHAETALLLYKLFLRAPEVSAEEKAIARDDYPTIENLAKEKQVRIGNRWLTPAQVTELRAKEKAFLQEAEAHYSAKKYELAEKSFIAASNVNPDGIQADYRLGIIYALAVRHAANAGKHFEKCVSRRRLRLDSLNLVERSNLAATLNNLAITAVRQRQFLTATKHWATALELGYPSTELLQNVGRFLYLSKTEVKSSLGSHLTVTLSSIERSNLDALYEELKRTATFDGYDSSIGWLYIPLLSEDSTSEEREDPAPAKKTSPDSPLFPGDRSKSKQRELRVVGYGTGFVVAPGVILTNRHVVQDGDEFQLRGGSPELKSLSAKVLRIDKNPQHDLALLRCDECRLPPLALTAQLPPRGSELRLLGYPLPNALGRTLKITRGVVAALPPHEGMVGKLQEHADDLLYDATINPGNSGGPAIDTRGTVVAVNSAILLPQAVGGGYAAGVTSLDALRFVREAVPNYQPPEERDAMAWEKATEHGAGSTVQIVVLKAPEIYEPADQDTAGSNGTRRTRPLEDPYCLACYGHRVLDCPNNVCANGTVRAYKKVVETFPNGVQVAKDVPIRVNCKTCGGRSKVDCPFCSSGLDERLR